MFLAIAQERRPHWKDAFPDKAKRFERGARINAAPALMRAPDATAAPIMGGAHHGRGWTRAEISVVILVIHLVIHFGALQGKFGAALRAAPNCDGRASRAHSK